MKKLFGVLLTGISFLSSQAMQAQTTEKVSLLNISTIGADKAAVRATRDFWNRVGEQKDEHWYKLSNGYQAVYTEGRVQARYMYDQKGQWKYSMLTYTERELPTEVRALVRSNYYDYAIGWVKEVHEEEAIVYVVHLEDAVSWKDLAVQDGEIRVLKEFCKQ